MLTNADRPLSNIRPMQAIKSEVLRPLIVAAVVFLCHFAITGYQAELFFGDLKVFSGIYSYLFGFVSIFTSVLLTIFSIIAARSTAFLQRISSTSAFKTFLSQIKMSIMLGFALAVITAFLAVKEIFPDPAAPNTLFWSWVALATGTVYSWIQVVRNTFLVLD